jgi:hypothetical protein
MLMAGGNLAKNQLTLKVEGINQADLTDVILDTTSAAAVLTNPIFVTPVSSNQ